MIGNCGECCSRWYCEDSPETCGAFPDPPLPTNADCIRHMTDEELAERNVHITDKCEIEYDWDEQSYEFWVAVYITSDGCQFDYYEDALEYELSWLQQPAKEDV